jgi:hypothetical protein
MAGKYPNGILASSPRLAVAHTLYAEGEMQLNAEGVVADLDAGGPQPCCG